MQTNVIDRVERRCSASGIPITRSGLATIASYLDEERASDREADRLRGGDQVVGVHNNGGNP